MSYDTYAQTAQWLRVQPNKKTKHEEKVAFDVLKFLGDTASSAGDALGRGASSIGKSGFNSAQSLITSPIDGAVDGVKRVISGPASTYGYRLDKMLNSGFSGLMNRVRAPDVAAERFITNMAGNMADKATDLLSDIASKAMSSVTDALVDSPARTALIGHLRKEDPIISRMSEQEVMDAYHSMTKFAPTLSKDKNAVRSTLRMASESEGGLSYHAIKGLADAERAVNEAHRKN